MTISLLTSKIRTPAAWVGADFEGDDSWVHALPKQALDAIDLSVRGLDETAKDDLSFSKADFPLGAFSEDLTRYANELENGRGFFLLRGLPVERYSENELRAIYFGIGLHLGAPVGQNPQGDLLGTVMNLGDPQDKNTRVFQTNLYLPYHTDPSDVVGLLCLRKAQRGGLSSLVSAAAVYNEIIEQAPEYLGLFYRAYHYAHLRTNGVGRSPVFSYHDEKLSCRYLRQYIELGHEQCDEPLTAVEREALDLFDRISQAEHMRLDMMLEPGDMQFANNYAVLHSRSAFEDADDPEARRKLLRLWLKMPNARTLAPDFPGRNGFEVAERNDA